MTSLAVRGLHVRHPGRAGWALRDINLDVPAGGHAVVLGSSGAGKTTLLRALLGAGRVEAGSVRHGDTDPFDRRGRTQVRRRSGLILPGGELAPRLRARTAAVSGCTHLLGAAGWWSLLRGRTPAHLADRLCALVAEQGLGRLLDRQVGQLSDGERQRLALVRALLGRPGLLLADEPTVGLDPRTAQQAVTALLAQPATLLVTTHDPAVAARFSRVLALRDGVVVHDGGALSTEQTGDLYARPAR